MANAAAHNTAWDLPRITMDARNLISSACQ
jgi:hypothetical protein